MNTKRLVERIGLVILVTWFITLMIGGFAAFDLLVTERSLSINPDVANRILAIGAITPLVSALMILFGSSEEIAGDESDGSDEITVSDDGDFDFH